MKKSSNEKLYETKDLPKIIDLTKQVGAVEKWGGATMVVAPAIDYNDIIKDIPKGKVILVSQIRERIAKKYHVDITCPLTAGIFINLCAAAAVERGDLEYPFWRVVKSKGELNEKFPGGVEEQKRKLEQDGINVILKGKKYYAQFK